MSWIRPLFAAFVFAAPLAVAAQQSDRRADLIDPPRVAFVKDGRPDSVQRSKNAVVNGASTRGWVVREYGEGRVRLAFTPRSHEAVVDVTYDADGFQIKYVSSQQLNYVVDSGNRRIHPNYNQWVKSLANDIQVAYQQRETPAR
jgi:hypothetical protein